MASVGALKQVSQSAADITAAFRQQSCNEVQSEVISCPGSMTAHERPSCSSLTPRASEQSNLTCNTCMWQQCSCSASLFSPAQAQTTLLRLLTSDQHARWLLLSAGVQFWSQLAQAGTLMLLTFSLALVFCHLIMK